MLITLSANGRLSLSCRGNREVFGLLLAAFVAAGLSMSAVQASEIAINMGMWSGMDMSGGGDCGACPDKSPDKNGWPLAHQLASCQRWGWCRKSATPIVAASLAQVPPAPSPPLLDRHFPPDPDPPRSTGLV